MFKLSQKNSNIGLVIEGDVGTTEVQNPTVYLRWCFSKELYQKTEELIANGCPVGLLVIVRYDSQLSSDNNHVFNREEERHLFKLTDSAGYITFRRPYAARVVATLVYGSQDRTEKFLKRTFVTRIGKAQNSDFKYDLLDEDGEWIDVDDEENALQPALNRAHGNIGVGVTDVYIPAEAFAKEPFDWMWVNWLFPGDPSNQCAFRQRRMFAYTVQPFIFLSIVVCLVIFAATGLVPRMLLLLLGAKGSYWRPTSFIENGSITFLSWSGLGKVTGSFFVFSYKDEDFFFLNAFSPIWLLIAFLLAFGFDPMPEFDQSWQTIAGEYLSWWVWGLVFLTLLNICTAKSESISKWLDKTHEQMMQSATEKQRKSYSQSKELLVCDAKDLLTPSPVALPPERRTIRLRMAEIKQAVCRPFAA